MKSHKTADLTPIVLPALPPGAEKFRESLETAAKHLFGQLGLKVPTQPPKSTGQ